MTNLAWLAKMPRDEALKILLNYCPYHRRDGSCPKDCAQWNAGICGVVRKATINYSFWLAEEHKDKEDAK